PAFGCAIRSNPRFISKHDAVQLDKAKISLSLGDKTSIEDAVKAILLNLDSRIGLSLYQMAPHMPPIWEPSW
ncbi:hypothetical protein KKF91_20955, partial [Myxococcota bacterium]|nr:hypothetical protein [Myxococcota bacterium]